MLYLVCMYHILGFDITITIIIIIIIIVIIIITSFLYIYNSIIMLDDNDSNYYLSL